MNELSEFRSRESSLGLARKLTWVVWIVSVAVLGLVALMQEVKIPLPDNVDLSYLPAFHAILNLSAAFFLVAAILAIKKGLVLRHRTMIYGALVCSLVFLLSYVLYHFTTPATIFGDLNGDGQLSEVERMEVGGMRTVYLVILISHVVLAAVSFPFILLTVLYALTNQFQKHRRFARRIFPIWLYVAVTGPVVYYFLRPYY
tara:strand:- start:797 stop:1399 length:603 start_codon:yes stop_codon:yes gene_type:complete